MVQREQISLRTKLAISDKIVVLVYICRGTLRRISEFLNLQVDEARLDYVHANSEGW